MTVSTFAGSIPVVLAMVAVSLVAITLGTRMIWVPTDDVYLAEDPPGSSTGVRGRVGRLIEQIGRPLAPVLAGLVQGKGRDTLVRRINAAGRPDGLDVDRFAAKRAGVVTLGLLVLVFYGLQGHLPIAVISGLAIAGSADLSLHRAARRRQDEIEQALPDLLDVITVSITAGGAFRPTLARVTQRIEGPLSEELTTALREMQLGTGRRTALTQLRERNTSPTLRQFVGAVLQAEELGTSIAATLQSLSDQMRRSAGQRAKQRADAVEKKIIVINAALFLPAMMIMLITVSLLGFGLGDALGR